MNFVIPVRPAVFENESRIAVFIPNEENIKNLIRKVPKSRWSPSHQCWHFVKTQENWAIFNAHFEGFTLNIQKDLAPLSIPASEMWERPKLQLKADYAPPKLSEGLKPSESNMLTSKTFFKIEKVLMTEQYHIAVPIPQEDKDKLTVFKVRIWHPQETMWLFPYNATTLETLQNLFGDKLQLPMSKEARNIQPPVDIRQMPLKPEYQNKENNPLWAELKNKQQLTDGVIGNHPVSSPSINPQELAKQRFETVDLEALLAAHNQQQPVVQTPVQIADKILVRLAQFWKGYLRLDFYYRKDWVEKLKLINGHRWHKEHNCWTLPHSPLVMDILNKMFGDVLQYDLTSSETQALQQPKISYQKPEFTPPQYNEEVLRLTDKMTLKRMAITTIKTYKNCFSLFLLYYNDIHPKDITKDQIINYMLHRIRVDKISVSIQNNFINAIKCYYELVLGRDRTYYDLQRPKKPFQLPNVLSKEEMIKLLNAVDNIKHKCILLAIYSGGLRLSEVINLRIADLRKDDKSIFVKAGKGKKDRYTLLSKMLLENLDVYFQHYKPTYWLFEGQTGGQYSPRSVQCILRDAVAKSGVNPFATVHTLRHSFATHLILNGHDSTYIQELLGHSKAETTAIYIHLTGEQIRQIESPLDNLKF